MQLTKGQWQATVADNVERAGQPLSPLISHPHPCTHTRNAAPFAARSPHAPSPSSLPTHTPSLSLVSSKVEFDAADVKRLIFALFDVVLKTGHDTEVQVRAWMGVCLLMRQQQQWLHCKWPVGQRATAQNTQL